MPTDQPPSKPAIKFNGSSERNSDFATFIVWERLRILYNALLIIPLCYLPRDVLICLLVYLNVCYFGGGFIEILLARAKFRSEAMRPVLFIAGTVLSLFVILMLSFTYSFLNALGD